ncbi:MAG: glycosyltransferase family 2 protein [Nevskia sp.]|nr:glycosyltransferase family 2 protein [Nevskia sp.]
MTESAERTEAAPRLPDITCVIPVYRAAAVLPELHRRLVAVLAGPGSSFEVIFVEDCGNDGSWAVIEALAGADPRVRGIRLMRNFGQHNAILCGIREARGEVIVTLDDDLQHPPEELPKLLAKLAEGFDVVYGPPIQQQHGMLRNLASMATKWVLQGAIGVDMAGEVCALRAFRSRLREVFADYQSPYVSIDVLLSWATANFGAVRLRHELRRHGDSGYTVGKLARHALNMITGFSTLPLQIASMLGFCFMAFGLAVLVYVVGRYLIQGTSAPGFPFLASIIAIFSGVQLFSIGIIGEYLARMHVRTMGQPVYAVRCRTGARESAA